MRPDSSLSGHYGEALKRHPLPLRECWAPSCRQQIIFLANRQIGKAIAVNPDSLSEDDRERIQDTGMAFDVDYDVTRHQPHKSTCKDREYKPPEKPRRGRKSKVNPGQGTLFKPPREPWEWD